MKKILSSALLASTMLSTNIIAADFEVEFGVMGISNELSGTINNSGTDINVQSDLGHTEKQTSTTFYGQIEHGIWFVPNIKIKKEDYSSEATKTLSKEIKFGPFTYTYNIDVNSELKMNKTDLTMYYKPIDFKIVEIDLGLTTRNLDIYAKIENAATGTETVEESVILPLGYAKASVNIPFIKGLSLEGIYQGITYDNNKIVDTKFNVKYEALDGLGVIAGIKKSKIEVEDVADITGDLEIEGNYFGLFYNF